MLVDCTEQEVPTHGPAFDITNHSHAIMQEFETLTPEDKRQVLDAVMISKDSVRLSGGDGESGSEDSAATANVLDSVMDVTLTGRRTDGNRAFGSLQDAGAHNNGLGPDGKYNLNISKP